MQRIHFYELEYAGFSNKLYRTVGKTKLFNDELSGIETIDTDIVFQSSALAYAQSESKEPYDIYDHFIGFKDGWISTDDLIKVFCEIEAGEQEHYYNFVKESFSNLPGLENNRYVTFLIEPNGNRIRFYNSETLNLIIEFMQIDKIWKNQMLNYIKSKYKNKAISLNIAKEQLEHNWINPNNSLNDKNILLYQ